MDFTDSYVSIGVLRLNQHAEVPQYGTEHSACFDLRANFGDSERVSIYNQYNAKREVKIEIIEPVPRLTLHPGDRAMIPTGIILDIPVGYCVQLYSRSGLALKRGIRLANPIGVIDADYKQELFILLQNTSDTAEYIYHGDRICQGEVIKTIPTKFEFIDKLTEIPSTRSGGFGSTGVQ